MMYYRKYLFAKYQEGHFVSSKLNLNFIADMESRYHADILTFVIFRDWLRRQKEIST
jgi:hypothetical protein